MHRPSHQRQLSLSEIQLALTQHTQDELLLRRLAKAVAQHVAGQDKVDLNSKKAHDPGRQPPGSFASGLGSSIRSSGGRSAAGGGGSGCRGTDGNSDRNKSRISPQRGDSDSRSLGVSTSSTNVGHSFRWKRGGGNDDGESSELTMPVGSWWQGVNSRCPSSPCLLSEKYAMFITQTSKRASVPKSERR